MWDKPMKLPTLDKQAKQKPNPRHKEQIDGCQRQEGLEKVKE